jgi:DHA1 family tetracycline resistance protein-like MFS transporter
MKITIPLLLWIMFLDTLALSVFFGTSMPLILAHDSILLSAAITSNAFTYGLVLAILPVGQFLFGPLWGQLADQYGRKIILNMTLLGSAFGFFLMALAIDEKLFWFFVLGRALSAVVAINGALAQASMADISQGVQKTKRFNLQFIMVSFGFILGPYVISLTTNNLHYSHVYWCVGVLYGLTLLGVALKFTETLRSISQQKIKFTASFNRIIDLFKEKPIRKILSVWLVFQIGWCLFFQYSGEFLYTSRHLPNEAINQLFSWVGVGIVLCQIILVHPLAKKITPHKIIPWSIIAVGSSLFLGGILPMGICFYVTLAIYCLGIAFFLTNFNAYVSNLTPASQQGRIMSLLTSGTAAMTILVTLMGNFIETHYLATPYVIGGVIILLSVVFWFKSRR